VFLREGLDERCAENLVLRTYGLFIHESFDPRCQLNDSHHMVVSAAMRILTEHQNRGATIGCIFDNPSPSICFNERRHHVDVLLDAVNAMPDDVRSVFNLSKIHRLSENEIQKRLQLTPSQVEHSLAESSRVIALTLYRAHFPSSSDNTVYPGCLKQFLRFLFLLD